MGYKDNIDKSAECEGIAIAKTRNNLGGNIRGRYKDKRYLQVATNTYSENRFNKLFKGK